MDCSPGPQEYPRGPQIIPAGPQDLASLEINLRAADVTVHVLVVMARLYNALSGSSSRWTPADLFSPAVRTSQLCNTLCIMFMLLHLLFVSSLALVTADRPSDLVTSLPGFEKVKWDFKVYSGFLDVPGPFKQNKYGHVPFVPVHKSLLRCPQGTKVNLERFRGATPMGPMPWSQTPWGQTPWGRTTWDQTSCGQTHGIRRHGI